ncbi:MAG: hypothetical protein ACK4P4_14055 [Allorhizobium sp.]
MPRQCGEMRRRASLFRAILSCRTGGAGKELRLSIDNPFKVLLAIL